MSRIVAIHSPVGAAVYGLHPENKWGRNKVKQKKLLLLRPHLFEAIDDRKVVFSYKDRSDGSRTRTMVLPAMELIRRFLLHVLPKRFMKIRYYGFLANVCKKKAVLLIRRLIGKYLEVVSFGKETTREKVLRLTGMDILLCPHCRLGPCG